MEIAWALLKAFRKSAYLPKSKWHKMLAIDQFPLDSQVDQDLPDENGISLKLADHYLHKQIYPREKSFKEMVFLQLKNTPPQPFTKQLFQTHFNVALLNNLKFDSYETLRGAFLRTKRGLRAKHVKKMNKWIEALYKEDIYVEHTPKVIVKHINSLVGYGVFAMQDIAPFSYVGEYIGIVRKRKRIADSMNDYIFGYNAGEKDTPYVIDAEKEGNVSRFINHSDEPNTNSRWIAYDGLSHIIFFSNKLIKQGEQITYDYGPYYWKKRPAPIEVSEIYP